MLDEETTEKLLSEQREAIAEADPERLAREPELDWVLAMLLARDEEAGRNAVRKKIEDDTVMLALLRSAYTVEGEQTLGEAAVRRVPRLKWANLVHLVGDEYLRERIATLAQTVDSNNLDAETTSALEIGLKIARREINPAVDWD